MSLKSGIKKQIVNIVNNNLFWRVLKPVARFGFFATHHRRDTPYYSLGKNDPYFNILNGEEVLHGPFKGMKYPTLASVGSVLYPKLLGSYESELHPTINQFLKKNYTEIIDIGCAEGYYAIGLGLKLKDAKIYAYDTDETGRRLCSEMATVNNIERRVRINSSCTAATLADFKFTGKGLIVCDCEGYENYLFTADNIANLKNCDLIIETHDFIDLSTSTNLTALFSKTHQVKLVKSIDDIEKAKTYLFKETEGFNLKQKMELYKEWRPSIMEWLICTSKSVEPADRADDLNKNE